MQYLLELKSGYDKINHLLDLATGDGKSGSLLDRFFYLVIEGKVTTDEEAASLLYGPGKDGRHPPYQKLKAKLKVYLPYRVCQLNKPRAKGASTTIFSARTYLLWARECKSRQKIMAAEWLLLEAFRTGGSVEQFRIVREAAETLCELYAGPLYDLVKFRRFREALVKNTEQEETVGILQMHYYKLRGIEVRKDRRLEGQKLALQSMFEETLSLTRSRDGSKVVQYGYGILSTICTLRGDYVTGRQLAEEALTRAQKLTYSKEGIVSVKVTSLIISLSKTGDYEACLQLLDKWSNLGSPGSLGRYVYLFYLITSLLALERYEESVEQSRVVDVNEVKNLYAAESALSYHFIFAYQYILAKTQFIPTGNLPKQITRFRLRKFLNEVQLFEKNKQGYNVHIRIIELFYLVIHKRYDAFIDRVESVEKYVQRYLSGVEHLRNGVFLKLLAAAGRYDFNANALERGEHENIEKFMSLENTAFLLDPASTEFIPYETLWRLFLQVLRDDDIVTSLSE